MSGQHTIHIQLSAGKSGKHGYKNGCVERTFRTIWAGGKPVGQMTVLFLQTNTDKRFLGTLVHSSGARLIFFPGLIDRTSVMDSRTRKTKVLGKDIDHLSIEPSFNSWRVTTTDQKDRLRYPTNWRSNSLVHCFGMSVKDSSCFELMAGAVEFTAKVPASDAKRRSEAVFQARDGSKFYCLDISSLSRPAGAYLYFDFLIDKTIRPAGYFHPDTLQAGPPWFAPPETLANSKTMECVSNVIKIRGFPWLVVVNVYYRTGTLPHPCIFGSEKISQLPTV